MIRMALNVKPLQSDSADAAPLVRSCLSQDIHTWRGRFDRRVEEPKADLRPNGRTTSKMHCSRREWTGDRSDEGTRHKDMACPLPNLYTYLTVEEARLSVVKVMLCVGSVLKVLSYLLPVTVVDGISL
jgi:hypothetical protein